MTKNRGFWDGMALGAGVGVALGCAFMFRRRKTLMELTKIMLGKSARRFLGRAQGTINKVANRFAQ